MKLICCTIKCTTSMGGYILGFVFKAMGSFSATSATKLKIIIFLFMLSLPECICTIVCIFVSESKFQNCKVVADLDWLMQARDAQLYYSGSPSHHWKSSSAMVQYFNLISSNPHIYCLRKIQLNSFFHISLAQTFSIAHSNDMLGFSWRFLPSYGFFIIQ